MQRESDFGGWKYLLSKIAYPLVDRASCYIEERLQHAGADLDRFIRFAQTCQIFPRKIFLRAFL